MDVRLYTWWFKMFQSYDKKKSLGALTFTKVPVKFWADNSSVESRILHSTLPEPFGKVRTRL